MKTSKPRYEENKKWKSHPVRVGLRDRTPPSRCLLPGFILSKSRGRGVIGSMTSIPWQLQTSGTFMTTWEFSQNYSKFTNSNIILWLRSLLTFCLILNSVLFGYQLHFLNISECTGFKHSCTSPQEILMYKKSQFEKGKLGAGSAFYKVPVRLK